MDRQDDERVSGMYALQNLRGRIDHIKQWLDTQGKGSALSEADLRVYEMIVEAEGEVG